MKHCGATQTSLSMTLCLLVVQLGLAAETRGPDWHYDLAAAMETGEKEQKPVLIDFYADWCGPCRMMDEQTYTDPRVLAALKDFVVVKVDTDRDSKAAFAYQVTGIPLTVILNVHQQVMAREVGFLNGDTMVALLKRAAARAGEKLAQDQAPDMGRAAPLPKADADTPAAELIELLGRPEPKLRAQAREELLRRDAAEVRPLLIAALADPYLGTRISAWEAVRELGGALPEDYSPWASRSKREQSLAAFLRPPAGGQAGEEAGGD